MKVNGTLVSNIKLLNAVGGSTKVTNFLVLVSFFPSESSVLRLIS